MLFNNKGLSLQFNWIFVLIAGFIFFAFFFSIIKTQFASEDVASVQKKSDDLNSLLKVSFASENTQKTIPFKEKLFFSCEDDVSEYYVGKLTYDPGRYDYDALFTPKILDGDEIIVSTRLFTIPFKVMPLVYVTNKDVEFVILNSSSDFTNIVFDMLPHDSTKTVIPNYKSYYDNNYDQIVFIGTMSDILPTLLPKTPNRFFAVKLRAEGDVYDAYGVAEFWEYDEMWNRKGESPYMGSELLIGAVISHSKEIYDCQLKKVLSRLKLLAKLHKNRLRIYSDYVVEGICNAYYANADDELDEIISLASRGVSGWGKELYEHTTRLRFYNFEMLNKYGECPLLY